MFAVVARRSAFDEAEERDDGQRDDSPVGGFHFQSSTRVLWWTASLLLIRRRDEWR